MPRLCEVFAFSPDGKLLASGSADETVTLWDVGTGREVNALRGLAVRRTVLPLTRWQGTRLRVGGRHYKLWDMASGAKPRRCVGTRRRCIALPSRLIARYSRQDRMTRL